MAQDQRGQRVSDQDPGPGSQRRPRPPGSTARAGRSGSTGRSASTAARDQRGDSCGRRRCGSGLVERARHGRGPPTVMRPSCAARPQRSGGDARCRAHEDPAGDARRRPARRPAGPSPSPSPAIEPGQDLADDLGLCHDRDGDQRREQRRADQVGPQRRCASASSRGSSGPRAMSGSSSAPVRVLTGGRAQAPLGHVYRQEWFDADAPPEHPVGPCLVGQDDGGHDHRDPGHDRSV